MENEKRVGIGPDNLPSEEGVYLILDKDIDDDPFEVDVYEHPIKGLCIYQDDIGREGQSGYDDTACHLSVQGLGIRFITKLRDLGDL